MFNLNKLIIFISFLFLVGCSFIPEKVNLNIRLKILNYEEKFTGRGPHSQRIDLIG